MLLMVTLLQQVLLHVQIYYYYQQRKRWLLYCIYLKFLQENEHNKVEKAKYLKFCADIIKENQNKKVMVLSRGNLILGKELDEFNIVLKKICSEFMNVEDYNHNVMVKTVHKSKGEEADVVIVVEQVNP